MASVSLNAKAPDFELKDLYGNAFRLSYFEGKSNVLIVLNRGFV